MSVSDQISFDTGAIEESLKYDQAQKKKLASDLLNLLNSQKKQFSAQSDILTKFKALGIKFTEKPNEIPGIEKIYTKWETFCTIQDPEDSENYMQDMLAIVDKLKIDDTKNKTGANIKNYLKAYA